MWRVNLFDKRHELVGGVLIPRVHQLPEVVRWHGRCFQLRERGEYHEIQLVEAVSEDDVGGVYQDSIEEASEAGRGDAGLTGATYGAPE